MSNTSTREGGTADVDRVLVTNDDGIDSPGLGAIVDQLSDEVAVTVVAPADNVSGVGTKRSDSVTYRRTSRGYVVDGTPADCVALGLRGLDVSPDVVVSGCNLGPNAGRYVLGRSGTVGAVIEAAWLGCPGIAVSAYDPDSLFARPADAFSYEAAAAAAANLLPVVVDAWANPDSARYLNVNVPVGGPSEMRLTEPGDYYDTSVRHDGETAHFDDYYGPQSRLVDAGGDVEWADLDAPAGTEQAAIRDGVTGVSPLDLPVVPVDCRRTRRAVERFDGR